MKTKYYRVKDLQCSCYFYTGYNATSMKELIKEFQNYIMSGNDAPSNKKYINSWKRIEDWLQGVELEISNKPFEELINKL